MNIQRIIIAVFFTQLAFTAAWAKDFTGNWQGTMKVNEAMSFELIFHIENKGEKYSATMDVPAQQQFGIPLDKVNITGVKVELGLTAAGINYSAQLIDHQLQGTYSQGALSVPLNLSKTEKVVQKAKRPQDPSAVPDYLIEQVSFVNESTGNSLAGTLTLPKGKVSHTVVLLSGSGPSTRDAVAFGHRIFAVLSDLLTKQGLAVLRFDDRGVAESQGDYKSATSLDFATDANAAVAFVKQHDKIKHTNVGFAGHSEGGLIGAVAASTNSDVDYFVSLAGPGTSGEQILIDQSYEIQKRLGIAAEKLTESDKAQRKIMAAIAADASTVELAQIMKKAGMAEKEIQQQLAQVDSPWFRTFVKTDPAGYLSQLTIPVFAVNGALDVQVLAKQNIAGIEKNVAEKYLTSKIYPQLNHLFQPATTGLPNEYVQIETTFSPKVAKDVAQWIKAI
ncbi:MAG: alpha/beta hydrolase [Colwellia sp.]|nr:alpha/beta hydrolase [Colwellia sp.]